MFLPKENIPKWLRKSDLYRNLKDDGVYIKTELIDPNSIDSIEDLNDYITISEKWGYDLINNISESAIDFITNNIRDTYALLYKNYNLNICKLLLEDLETSNFNIELGYESSKKSEILFYWGEFLTFKIKMISHISEWDDLTQIEKQKDFFKIIARGLKNKKDFKSLIFIENNYVHPIQVCVCEYKNSILSFKIGEPTYGPAVNNFSKANGVDTKGATSHTLNIPITFFNREKIYQNFKNHIENIK